MARPDPALLDASRYPFTCEIGTRYGDLDTNHHINNAAFAVLVEEGRARFHAASGFRMAGAGWSVLVATLSIDYLAQAFYPDPLTIHAGYTEFGRSSYRMGMLLSQGGRPVALARTVMVCTVAGRSSPLPRDFLDASRPWMLRA